MSHLHRTIPVRKTDRRKAVPPYDLETRAAHLEEGLERLVSQAKSKLNALGIDTTGKLPLHLVAMAKVAKRKAGSTTPRQ